MIQKNTVRQRIFFNVLKNKYCSKPKIAYLKRNKNNKDLVDKIRLCGSINFNNKPKIRHLFCVAAKNSKTSQ